ncbi:hypothetical protein D4R51_00175, partial [bacterium]
MKSTTRLQASILILSAAIIMTIFAYFSFAIPLWVVNTNSTTPASPATYSPTANYSFQINFTNVTNTSFQMGMPSGTLMNLTDNTTGLVGYWRLNAVNGTNYTADSSGYGNNGQFWTGGSSVTPVAGKIGNALQFDGVNDYVDAGNGQTILGTSVTKATMEFWVKPSSLPTGGSNDWNTIMIISQTSGNSFPDGNNMFHISLNGVGTLFGTFNTISKPVLVSNSFTPVGTWTHIVLTADVPSQKLYINGVLQ